MFSFSKYRILNKHLAFKCHAATGTNWWLKDDSLVSLVDGLFDRLGDIDVETRVPAIELLKKARRKEIFRLWHPDDQSKSFIIKIFYLRHLSHKLSFHIYALDEAANLIEVANRGVKTPDVFAYGQAYGRFGLVSAGIVVMEDLRGYSTIGDLLKTNSGEKRKEIFVRTIPLFQSLYWSNCNHIDVNNDSIMLSADKSNTNVFLLDFQHAKFYKKPNLEILMFEAGYFARTCSKWIHLQDALEWVNEILDRIGIKNTDEIKKAKERFEYYYYLKDLRSHNPIMSRKQRKKIR
jgi:tRNA A-37 threonylcarbamoyl transferase component Bud32